MTPDEAIAREDIRHTMSIYNNAGDRGRVEELATAFTDDGVLEFPGAHLVGRPAIAAGLGGTVDRTHAAASAEVTPFVRHHLTTCRIELTSATEADGWTYFAAMTPIGLDHCGVYVDRFRKVGDTWLIAHRRVKIDWRDPRSTMARATD